MFFLQVQTSDKSMVEGSTAILFNYGAVGALLVLCILAIIFLVRFFIKQNEKRDAYFTGQINEMRTHMNKYIEEDRREMLNVITQNTQALRELKIEIHGGKSSN